MKRLATCFFAISLFTPHIFAADALSRVVASGGGNAPVSTSRDGAGRNISRINTEQTTETNSTSVSRTAVRTPDTGVSRDIGASVNAARNVVSRSSATGNTRDKLEATFNNSGRNARVSAASINNNPMVRRSGMSLRPSTAEVGGRATIGDSDVQTGSNIASEIRSLSARALTTKTQNRETIAQAKERLEQTAELNKSCQEQYNECMDQFCAVVDANQKRCSCSSNLSRYTKVEKAVKEANAELNEVAQRIRYVGLTADEIRAIMSATEAEDALSTNKDNTESRNMLEDIEKMIKDPKSATAYYADNGFGLDLDLDFTSDDFSDMFSLDFLTNNTSSVSNLRGTELYNAARRRCNTVIKRCKEVGATADQVTGNYDLAIDKDCIAYEQGLNKMNDTLVANVRSANRMLQKARLAVMQNKNQYDAKGCVAALDACMTDDMVCGDDYYKCLDPTKRYIDENGEVVLGQNIADITLFMENFNNASINATMLRSADGIAITPAYCRTGPDEETHTTGGNNGTCNIKYLLTKIGTGQNVTDNGLCRAVLDKCQQYTYDSNGNYKPYNDIVVNYIQRAMVNIKAAQQQIISDYASTCIVDIATCYNKQVSQVNTWASNASVSGIYNVMTGACRNVAMTCSYAVFAADPEHCPTGSEYDTGEQVNPNCTGDDCEHITWDCNGANANDCQKVCLQSISEMFYQSLLCPDNSIYQLTTKAQMTCEQGDDGKYNGYDTQAECENAKSRYVNDLCMCNENYVVWNNSCMPACSDPNAEYNVYGTCICKTPATTGGVPNVNGMCECASGYTRNPTTGLCGE